MDKRLKKTSLLAILFLLIALIALSTATYAWFTQNRITDTSTVSVHTKTDNFTLELSRKGGSAFQAENGLGLTQVNETDINDLLPVSTADLINFVYNPLTNDGKAEKFLPVNNEEHFYHGRVYFRAKSDSTDGEYTLYLDESVGIIADLSGSELENASRIGITIDGENPQIYTLSDDQNSFSGTINNTYVNGQLLGPGYVVGLQNGTAIPIADPSKSISTVSIDPNGTNVTRPESSLGTFRVNQIYCLDVYFYLEGTDPDCSDGIRTQDQDLCLAIYGMLS